MMTDRKYHCPDCDLDVPRFKKADLWGAVFFGLWYAVYYHFKKPECPICGHVFTNEEEVLVE